MQNLQIGKTYTFNTQAPGILGTTLRNAKLLAVMDYQTAITYENIDLKFRSIYPLLPVGTPDSPETAIYYRFLSESGEKVIYCDRWIVDSTIEVVEHINFQVTFTDAGLADIPRVRDAINALGYTNYSIKQI